MKVTLLSYTPEAAEMLIFTKSTRLTLSPNLMNEIRAWPKERKHEELKYIANTIRSSHEFADVTFLIQGVSRNFTHQFVRTRSASYAQQSMRVNDMSNFDFVMPERFRGDPAALEAVNLHNERTSELYKLLVRRGHAVEDARSILPTNVSTNIVAKYNLRNFADLARSRSGGRTQAEYQAAITEMVVQVLAVWPWASDFIFGDKGRDYFDEIEAFAKEAFPDLMQRGKLLKIVDKMRGVK
jgi:flavin-dependent thymidylate synthase